MTRLTHPDAHPDDPHYVSRSGWLRAAVLGANDGILSVASVLTGVAAAGADHPHIALAGIAALSAGALSMAAGEYVSVSSQSDIERADMSREANALEVNPDIEEEELALIYMERGLSADTAALVARELHEHDALAAHMRDELGLSEIHSANPVQAALASGATFSVAAALPLVAAILAPHGSVVAAVTVTALLALAILGAVGAHAGGAPKLPAVMRVVVWGVLAMAITALIGKIAGVTV